ncbi:MAG TPA: enoyl-CoA hydratase/isomerase family protein [Thermoleophilaceae bacterium]|nr:enoyl-CoA hydratase/isomerase family protein [Thermoleophilaceae bacterium]
MPTSRVRLERDTDPDLAELVIASPPLNLFDRALIDNLIDAVADVSADPPRALLVRAEGKVVSGGVDVELFDGLSPEAAGELWTELLGKIVEPIERLPAPVIFAAHGLTLTAAFEIALACDLIVAARSAKFGLVEAVVGLTPSMGGTQRLAERAGSSRARELVMTGELFGAEQLERWDVVNRVFDDAEFEQRSRELALKLAAGPTRAHAMTKHVVRRYLVGGVEAADEAIRCDAGELFASEDLKDAVKTFLEQGPGHAAFRNR